MIFESKTCYVCMGPMSDRPFVAPCGHMTHKKCAAIMQEKSFPKPFECGLCKVPVVDNGLIKIAASNSPAFKDMVLLEVRRLHQQQLRLQRAAKKKRAERVRQQAKLQVLLKVRAVKRTAKEIKARNERLLRLQKIRNVGHHALERDARAAARSS